MHAPSRPMPAATTDGVPAIRDLSLEAVTEYRTFLSLEEDWNRLVEEAGISHPFLTHEWMRTWWDCFGHAHALHVLVLREGTGIIAIAPLMVSHVRIYGIPVRLIESMANLYTERFSLIVTRRHEEIFRRIWRHLVNERARWDVLRLTQLPDNAPSLDKLPRLAREDGFPTGIWRSSDSPYVNFEGGWDEYVSRLSSNLRRNVRRRHKRLEELGPVDLEVIPSGENLEEALEEGFRIEGAGWKGRIGTAIRNRPDARAFYTQLAKRFARRGWLRLHFLAVDRRRIAFEYAIHYRNKLYLLKAGYDPEYARYSPSNLLCYLVFRNACEHGLSEYEFLGNKEESKLSWTGRTRPHYWLFVFSRSWRGRGLHYVKFKLVQHLRRFRLYRRLRDLVTAPRSWLGRRRAR